MPNQNDNLTRFLVTRTSDFHGQNPLPGDNRVSHLSYTETEVYKGTAALTGTGPEWWYRDGTNHRITPLGAFRDVQKEAYIIALPGLAGLLDFVASAECEVIIGARSSTVCVPAIPAFSLELYDGYRE